jgi:hypothetical protein
VNNRIGAGRAASALVALVFVVASGGPANGQVELDRDTAAGLGNAPNALKACVLGGSGVTACPSEHGTEPRHRIRLEWRPPPLGKVSHYEVYRYRVVTGNPLRDAPTRVALCGSAETASCGASSTRSFVDNEQLPNSTFVYFVVAEFDDRTRSGPSNFATITAVE